MTDEEIARAIELLEAAHVFPGDYALSIIAVSYEQVTTLVRAAVSAELAEPIPETAYVIQMSGGGKYRSHRVSVPVPDAHAVVRLILRVRAIEGVITVL